MIIETDIGRDPDDLFAILYLIAAGVDIETILITPGDKDQVGICRNILETCQIKIPIGVPERNLNRNGRSSGGIHYALSNKLRMPLEAEPCASSEQLLKERYKPDTEFFVIGPPTGLGSFFSIERKDVSKNRLTMQGGFVPYSTYRPKICLEKFEGKQYCPSFNFNGDINSAMGLISDFQDVSLIGKNVCHTIEYTQDKQPPLKPSDGFMCYEPASYLFKCASELYFKKHKSKKFHDPTAAVCMLHPEIGSWISGNVIRNDKREITTTPFGNHNVLVDINRDKLWQHIKDLT